MENAFSTNLRDLQLRFDAAASLIAPLAEEIDARAEWPTRSLEILAEAGLLGLHVPKRLGGLDQGLLALAIGTETLARACSSTAMCYGMHCVGAAVIAAKATAFQEEHYLKPIAQGRHITTLALSEAGTGANFYLPQARLHREGDFFIIDGTKQFVTSGGKADSYVISTAASAPAEAGEFSCFVLDRRTPGITWLEPWNGFGMRGNSARAMSLAGVRVPKTHLLGREGDEVWYVFEVVTPYFIVAMSGVYLGIAQAALDIAVQHVKGRRYDYSGERLADFPIIQEKIANLWIMVEKARHLLYEAARRGDMGDIEALLPLLASKVAVAESAIEVTNEAMTLCGGIAYRENGKLARLLRDARAAHVMAPTTELVKQWVGRLLLDLPML